MRLRSPISQAPARRPSLGSGREPGRTDYKLATKGTKGTKWLLAVPTASGAWASPQRNVTHCLASLAGRLGGASGKIQHRVVLRWVRESGENVTT